MPLSDIVDVNITRETATVSQKSFNVGMFLGLHKNFTEVAKEYASLAEVLADGFLDTSPEYKAASVYFGQEVSPNTLVIGRRVTADSTALAVQAAAAAGVVYTVELNGVAYTYTSTGVQTAAQIATAFAAVIDAAALFVATANSPTSGSVYVTPSVASTPYTIAVVTTNITKTHTAPNSWATDLQAVYDSGIDWYAFGTYSHLEADIKSIAAWANANVVLYGYSTSNAEDKAAASTGVISDLQALSYDRAFGMWSAGSSVDASGSGTFAEMAWIGDRLAYNPGESTWMFKDLAGITVDSIGTTASGYVRGYNGNTYETVGGSNITREGVVASGEYIDVIQGVDWMTSRMTERIYARLVQLQKVPFTDIGIQVIVGEVRGTIEQAGELGIIDLASGYTITYPKVLDIPAVDRAARRIPADMPIRFTARLAGAIHKVVVAGSVNV